MDIRTATTEDVEHLVHLFEQLGYPIQAQQVMRQLVQLQFSGTGQAFVAQEYGTLYGVAIVHIIMPLHVDAAWALLSALVVDDARRSSGIGAQLLAAAEGFAMQHNCVQLELSSSRTRNRAHEFYRQNGYEEKRLRFVKIFS